ncbi:MAG TPA: septum formation initiator family protein [Candidatus Saccharimonas sp.]|nr:septum formation initiator family protein [Candidatus Saccharimonas sp.]
MNGLGSKFNLVTVLNVAGFLVIVYLCVVLGQTIKHNYDLNQQIASMKGQITLLQDQRDTLSYNTQYYQTDSFREREARAKLGLQLPGESVVILPKPASDAPAPVATTTAKPRPNLQQWLDFLTGR